MKPLYRMLSAAVITVCILFMGIEAKASHAVGADLSYDCLGNNQYRITLTFFRDCDGIAAPTSPQVSIRSTSCGSNLSLTLSQQGPAVEVSQLCPSQIGSSTCNGGSLPGIQKYVYTGVITLTQQCTDWVVGYNLNARNASVTNLNSPDTRSLYVEARINNANGLCNDSPIFTSLPTPFLCAGSQFFYNHGAVDLEGDSLVYTLIQPREAGTGTLPGTITNIPYNSGFSVTNPMSITGSFGFSSSTGQISATPSTTQNAVITVLVQEYRNGVLIGTTLRDMQFVVINCPNNNPPTTTGVNGTGNFSITIPANQQTCFNIPTSDPDAGQSVTMTWNNGISGASFTSSGSPFPTGTFCWTPPASASQNNPNIFIVTVQDNACPSISTQLFTFSVNVCGLEVNLGQDQTLCASSYTISPLVSNANGNVTYAWSDGSQGQSLTVTQSGTYLVTVTDANGCSDIDTINVTLNGSASQNLFTFEDTIICAGSSITLSPIAIGTTFSSYTWSTGESTASIMATASGVYSVTVTNQAGCQYVDSVIVSVDNSLSVTITGGNICAGNTFTFDAGPGFASYLWSDQSTGQTLTVGNTGIYSVTVTSVAGCTATDTARLVNNVAAFVSLGPDRSSCGPVTLSVRRPPGYSYVWNTGATTPTLTVTTSGVYILTVTDLAGCSASDTVTVTISTIGTVNLIQDSVINLCGGATQILDAGAGYARYQWSTGDTSSSISVAASGVYSVTVIDAIGCSVTDQVVISISPSITGAIVSGTQCAPLTGTADLTVLGGTAPYQFAWSGPNGFTATTEDINGLAIGTYSVLIIDGSGCSGTASTTIGLPTVTIDAGPDSVFICQGGSVQLNATGGVFYNWLPAAGLSNPDIANPIASPTTTTTYVVVGNQPSGELVVNGDFSQGNTGFNTTYTYTTTNLVPEGTYAVVTNPNPLHPAFQGSGRGGSGNFMAINGSVNPGRQIWCQTVPVNPNTDYSFSTWISTLVANSPAVLEFSINGQLLGTPITAPASLNTWIQFFSVWNSGSATSAQICIVNTNTVAGGNDFGLDDISFTSVCQGTDSIVVVVNQPPVVSIGDNDTTCLGTPFTYDAGAGFVDYLWSDGSTGQTLTTSVAGTYSVTVTDANGCTGTDSASLSIKNCCFPAGFGNLFTTIDSTNNQISSDAVWAGKYYITADVTVSGAATLDLTNVDVVFAEGRGMIFTDNSKIRANNSVFRSCDATTAWAGFDFLDASSGVFNANVVKNAEVAMDIRTGQAVQVSNSEFSNFAIGIQFDNAGAGLYAGSVTANTFVQSGNRPTYFDSTTVLTDFFAIKAFDTYIDGVVSQNSFVNGMSSIPTLANLYRFYGVYSNASGLVASSNTFTNMYRAFDVTGNGQAVTLENNKIEYTQRSYFDIYPIRVTDITTSQVLVEGNEVTFSELAVASANQAGIYVDNARNLIIADNSVSGFATALRIGGGSGLVSVLGNNFSQSGQYGIWVDGGSLYTISENTIDKAAEAGIYLNNVTESASVRGNIISVDNYNGGVGIRYATTAPIAASTIVVADNCVKNSSSALQFTSLASLQNTIPTIRNNYLYNYQAAGLWSVGFLGQVGSCNNYPASAGRNSFISNYLAPFGTALDVRSDSAQLIVAGNSANLVINFPNVLVNTSCNTTSNTDCGNQIGNNEWGGRVAGPLAQLLMFNEMVEANYPLTLNGNDYSLNSDFMTAINASNNKLNTVLAIMDILNQNSVSAEMDRFFSNINAGNVVTANELKWVSYVYSNYKGNYAAANAYLNAYMPNSADEQDKVAVERIKVQLAMNGASVKSLNAGEIATLQAIDSKDALYSAVARDMVQAAIGEHDYKFEQPQGQNLDASNSLAGQQLGENFIAVFPNPANSQVTIRFYTDATDLQQINVRVVDILGQVMFTSPVQFNNGEVTLDVSTYASGAYIISLVNEKEVISHTKLVKF